MLKPDWAFNVGVMGRPHDLGNISKYLGKATSLENYVGWLANNFDASISWKDLEWIREYWKGPMIIKGILDPQDAKDAASFGADGIVVSNHGGRQLDGVLSTAKALPPIAQTVGSDLTISSRLGDPFGTGRGADAGSRGQKCSAGALDGVRTGSRRATWS